jgi:predicted ribosome quality control (RQC) complex YloA/Tae2 family protein
MEATFFRFLARELAPALQGQRIEKLFGPAPGIWTLKLGADRFVLAGTSRQCPFLFLARENPGNPPSPTAQVMWLRKRLKNRRIIAVRSDWPRRTMALELSPGEGRHLLIDLASGLTLTEGLDQEFGSEPAWPGLDEVRGDPEIWRRHPQLSPLLRRRLATLEADEAERLIGTLGRGQSSAFTIITSPSGRLEAVPWDGPGEAFGSALEAAEKVGRWCLGSLLDAGAEERRDVASARKRIRRTLQRVEEDMERMGRLSALQEQALQLKAALGPIDSREKRGSIRLMLEDGGVSELALDPSLTVLDNMERMFRQAAKGKRGMVFLAKRKSDLEQDALRLEAGRLPVGPPRKQAARQEGKRKPASTQGSALARFRTSDGFLLFRGRNNQANHRLLTREASPFDLWFHVEDGPGAHVILRRDHGEQEIPERSLVEAAVIAAQASYCKGADEARVMCARVKDVRTIKGAEPGRVRVDRVFKSLRVRLDPDLEQRLSIDRT